MKKYIFLVFAIVGAGFFGTGVFTGVQGSSIESAKVPSSWYKMPEDSIESRNLYDVKKMRTSEAIEANAESKLIPVVQKIYEANRDALDQIQSSPTSSDIPIDRPIDWVPWHFSAFATDLGVTFQGLLGILTMKATPGVEIYWYREPSHPAAVSEIKDPGKSDEATGVFINSESTEDEIESQVEPIVQAALAKGLIKNTDALKAHLQGTVRELKAVLESLESDPGSPWWLSRFRLDFIVDAAGNVLPAVSVGGEMRFRFQWDRIRNERIYSTKSYHLKGKKTAFYGSLQNLVTFIEKVLKDSTLEVTPHGFKPFNFRVGIGATANGNVGIAKGNLTILGHIGFNKDVLIPGIHSPSKDDGPKGLLLQNSPDPRGDGRTNHDSMAAFSLEEGVAGLGGDENSVLMIEKNPSEAHLNYAKQNGILVGQTLLTQRNSGISEAIYRISRDSIKKGIEKAFHIGNFFAKQAENPGRGRWNIYLIRCDFDASLSGSLGLAGLGGAISAQLNLINEDF